VQNVAGNGFFQLEKTRELGVCDPAAQKLVLEELLEEFYIGAGLPDHGLAVPLGQGELLILVTVREDVKTTEDAKDVVFGILLDLRDCD